MIAGRYLGRTPRALAGHLQVWERGSDMALAAHFTPGRLGVTTTVETVRFERPDRIHFRVVRGPVPHVAESFVLDAMEHGTTLTWKGELGTDLWALGARWGDHVAASWEQAVRASVAAIAAELERRPRRNRRATRGPATAIDRVRHSYRRLVSPCVRRSTSC